MTTASQRTVQVLEQIVKPVPSGTNLLSLAKIAKLRSD